METVGVAPRDVRIDNAKGVLVTLVVVGHTVALLDERLAAAIYAWLYGFHMPAFVLLAGLLSGPPTERRTRRLLQSVAAPFLLFQVVHVLEVWALRGAVKPSYLLDPGWTLWFLVALVAWRLTVPLWLALRPWAAIVVAVALSMLGSLQPSLPGALSFDRVLGLLPCFVVGLLLRDWVRRRGGAFPLDRLPRPRLVATLAVGAASVACWAFARSMPRGLLRHADTFEQMRLDPVVGVGARTLVLVLACLVGIALVTAMPARTTWWTHVGVRSMYVYLLHAPILFAARETGVLAGKVSTLETVLLVVAAGVLTLGLASGPVRSLTRWAVEPPLGALLRPPSPRP